MAERDTRTLCVAVSNSALGIVLLGVGGVFVGARLSDVSRRVSP